MSMPGRPLRFLGTVLGGWVALRVFMLWPGQVPTLVRAIGDAEVRSAEDAVARTATRIGAAMIPPSRADAVAHTAARIGAPVIPSSRADAVAPTATRIGTALVLPSRADALTARTGARGATSFSMLATSGEAQTGTPHRSPLAPRSSDAEILSQAGYAQKIAGSGRARGTKSETPANPAPLPGDSVVLFPFHPDRQAATAARPRSADRWSASAYALLRPGEGAAGALATPQLAGSQVAARVAYSLAERGRVALVARAATALGVRQQEAAVGVEWQPTSAPVRLVAEQRIGLAGIGSGPGVGAVGGGAVALGGEARAEGYVQAGYVARDRGTGYVDGAARVVAPPRRLGTLRLELGVALWGAAQRGASRVDMGPSAALVVPVAGKALRLSLDWRERVSGTARPGSGPALTLGSDF